jgi:6-phosphogluconolactonase
MGPNSGSHDVSAYAINNNTGALTPISGSPFPAGTSPVGLSITASGKFAYVVNSGSDDVSGYSLNATTGTLTAITGSPFGAGTKPVAIAANPTSRFVYVANLSSNNVSGYSINSTTGALVPVSGSPVSAGTAPATLAVDPSGKFVFTGNATSDDVSAFSLNNSTGALTPLAPGPVRARVGPASLVVSSGTTAITYTPAFTYVADFEGGLPGFLVGASTGALTTIPGSAGAARADTPDASSAPFGSGSPRSVAITSNEKFLYTANADGSNTVGEYILDAATGALANIGSIATGSSPYGVVVDPSNQFAYAIGIDGRGLYGYKINATTGVLTAMAGSPFTKGVLAPDSISVDPTVRFVFVANECCFSPSSPRPGITVFTINPFTGALTTVTGSPFSIPTGASPPSAVTPDPTGRFIYVANGEGGGTGGATVYSIKASTGALSLVTSAPVPGGTAPWDLVVDPTDRFLYMTNNDDTISGYTINNSTGSVKAMSGSPFFIKEGASRGIVVDPSGKFLYLVNSEDTEGIQYQAEHGRHHRIIELALCLGSGSDQPRTNRHH